MLRIKSINLKRCKYYFIFSVFLVNSAQIYAGDDFYFNPAYLRESGVDISRFERPAQFLPGTYDVELYVNDKKIGQEIIKIIEEDDVVKACFTSKQILSWNLNFKQIPDGEAVKNNIGLDNECVYIDNIVPEIKVHLKSSEFKVNVSIPQAYYIKLPRGYVSPELWVDGDAAGFLKYYINSSGDSNFFGSNSNYFSSIGSGVNLGAWRFRHNGFYSKPSGKSSSYKSAKNYIERDIVDWKSRLTIGDSNTPGRIFSGLGFRGVQLKSEDQMLPQSLIGFSPVITGNAETNAVIKIYQAGVQIYQTEVNPGPFLINDLYNTSFSGDMEVVVQESDGRSQKFIVPYSNVAQLLRPGQSRYSITLGEIRSYTLANNANFLELTYERGLNNFLSLYGGSQLSDKYFSASLGAAFNTKIGAISFDVTQSHAKDLPDNWMFGAGTNTGQSYGVSYNKNFVATKTNLVLAAYRYSSEGYLTLEDYSRVKSKDDFSDLNYFSLQKNRFQMFLTQETSYGSFSFNAFTESYWGNKGRRINYQFGYGKGFKWGNIRLSFNRYENSLGNNENQFGLNVNVPFDKNSVSANYSHNKIRGDSLTVSASGTLDDESKLTYGLYTDYQQNNKSNTVGANLSYQGAYVGASVNYSKSKGFEAKSGFTLSGAVVGHEGGLNFVRNTGESFAIVQADGASGAGINNTNNVISENGYGIYSYLTPYRQNSIWINPEGASSDVEISGRQIKVAPTSGAIVKMKFDTVIGSSSIIKIEQENDFPVPFGAEVKHLDSDILITQVAQGGYASIRGVKAGEGIKVIWGNKMDQQCKFTYNPPEDLSSLTHQLTEFKFLCK